MNIWRATTNALHQRLVECSLSVYYLFRACLLLRNYPEDDKYYDVSRDNSNPIVDGGKLSWAWFKSTAVAAPWCNNKLRRRSQRDTAKGCGSRRIYTPRLFFSSNEPAGIRLLIHRSSRAVIFPVTFKLSNRPRSLDLSPEPNANAVVIQ